MAHAYLHSESNRILNGDGSVAAFDRDQAHYPGDLDPPPQVDGRDTRIKGAKKRTSKQWAQPKVSFFDLELFVSLSLTRFRDFSFFPPLGKIKHLYYFFPRKICKPLTCQKM